MVVSPFGQQSEYALCRTIIGSLDIPTRTLKICARWTLFNTPLAYVIHPKGDAVGRLKGSLLSIAQDGTIAVIDIDGLQLYAKSHPRSWTFAYSAIASGQLVSHPNLDASPHPGVHRRG